MSSKPIGLTERPSTASRHQVRLPTSRVESTTPRVAIDAMDAFCLVDEAGRLPLDGGEDEADHDRRQGGQQGQGRQPDGGWQPEQSVVEVAQPAGQHEQDFFTGRSPQRPEHTEAEW
jgi:hypothetical protein